MEEKQVSERFNSSDADIILISSDNVQFKVHKTNLITASTIFKDMFETGSSEEAIPKIELEESGAVLEVILPYVYPAEKVKDFDLHSTITNNCIRSLVKYSIWCGVLSVEAALNALQFYEYSYHSENDGIFLGYSFGVLIGKPELKKKFFNYWLDSSPSISTFKSLSTPSQMIHSEAGIELEREWARRCWKVRDLYKTLELSLDNFAKATFNHNRNTKKSQGKCGYNVKYSRDWTDLSGFITSKDIKLATNGRDCIECLVCERHLSIVINSLLEGVQGFEREP